MAYRETPRSRARRQAARQSILSAAEALVSEGGFRNAGIAQVAERAGIAVGTVYRYFQSKGELFSEVFRIATQREVDRVEQALQREGTASERLEAALRLFAGRALRGSTMAWALIAEPVDPQVDAERLHYRRTYAELFERTLRAGMESGEFRQQEAALSSTAIVGAIAEALVGPLSPTNREKTVDHDAQISAITQFCLMAVKERGDRI